MNKKIIIGVSLFMLLVIGVTFAWFTWNSEENTNVGVTIEGINITYEDGEDIKGINLIPVSSKEKGENDGNFFNDIVITERSSVIPVWYVIDGRWPENGCRK